MSEARRVYEFLQLTNAAYYPSTFEIWINITAIVSIRPITDREMHGCTEITTTTGESIRVEETMEQIIQLMELPTTKNDAR